jgi:hypothetical protein
MMLIIFHGSGSDTGEYLRHRGLRNTTSATIILKKGSSNEVVRETPTSASNADEVQDIQPQRLRKQKAFLVTLCY